VATVGAPQTEHSDEESLEKAVGVESSIRPRLPTFDWLFARTFSYLAALWYDRTARSHYSIRDIVRFETESLSPIKICINAMTHENGQTTVAWEVVQ
jgi:hypothetical protein